MVGRVRIIYNPTMTGGEVARWGCAELWVCHNVNVYVMEVYVKLAILAYFFFEHFKWP